MTCGAAGPRSQAVAAALTGGDNLSSLPHRARRPVPRLVRDLTRGLVSTPEGRARRASGRAAAGPVWARQGLSVPEDLPDPVEALGHGPLEPAVGRRVVARALQDVGQVLLACDRVRGVVRVLVPLPCPSSLAPA